MLAQNLTKTLYIVLYLSVLLVDPSIFQLIRVFSSVNENISLDSYIKALYQIDNKIRADIILCQLLARAYTYIYLVL